MATSSHDNINQAAEFDAETLRANTYSLLARLLRRPPDAELLSAMSNIESNGQSANELDRSWYQLKQAAAHAQTEQLDDEFHTLFIGLGHGEVIPYGSWYQTGFIMDKPLARLRQDLNLLGIIRQEQVSEPEDHIAAVCECMAILIDSHADLKTQQAFFKEHLQSWLDQCFHDIEQAPSAQFYRSVGVLGRHFYRLEARYLDVPNE